MLFSITKKRNSDRPSCFISEKCLNYYLSVDVVFCSILRPNTGSDWPQCCCLHLFLEGKIIPKTALVRIHINYPLKASWEITKQMCSFGLGGNNLVLECSSFHTSIKHWGSVAVLYPCAAMKVFITGQTRDRPCINCL